MNPAMSARRCACLLTKSRMENSDFQIMLTRYALERLLFRLGASQYRERFTLKGVLLFATWLPDPHRATRDLDLLGTGSSEHAAIAEIFREICTLTVTDDGVAFDVKGLKVASIREDAEHGGVRIRTTAFIDVARIAIQIDTGFGDAITPAPVDIVYPVLLDNPAPKLRAYPVETVIAEKFHAMVHRGIANSRLKDFYDLWFIIQTFELRRSTVVEAMRRTFERRGTAPPVAQPVGLSDDYVTAWSVRWRTFLSREHMAAAPADLAVVVSDLRIFFIPLLTAASPDDQKWLPKGPWAAAATLKQST